MDRVLFLGGPGNISTTTALDLLANGWKVGIFTLLGSLDDEGICKHVEMFFGNRNDPGALENVVQAFRPDVVVDYSCFATEQCAAAVTAIRGKVAQYVFVSTADVYGYPLSRLPMAEDDPWGASNCDYAASKRKCEELLSAVSSSELAVTVIRPVYSMGNRFAITALTREGGSFLVSRLKAGLPVLSVGDGTTLLHVSVAANTGRMIARTVGHKKSFGTSYTCGHPFFITHDQYIGLFAEALGVKPNIVHIPTDLLYQTGASEITEQSILNALTRHNIAFSVQRFQSVFPDFTWDVTLEQAVNRYIAFNERTGGFPRAEEEIFEDRLIRAWSKLTDGFYINEKSKSTIG